MYWVKGNLNAENKRNDSKQPEDEKVENTADSRNYKILSHWAKMAPLIEGAIEAPIQFLFQVCTIEYIQSWTFTYIQLLNKPYSLRPKLWTKSCFMI